jgi:hypothetical protein
LIIIIKNLWSRNLIRLKRRFAQPLLGSSNESSHHWFIIWKWIDLIAIFSCNMWMRFKAINNIWVFGSAYWLYIYFKWIINDLNYYSSKLKSQRHFFRYFNDFCLKKQFFSSKEWVIVFKFYKYYKSRNSKAYICYFNIDIKVGSLDVNPSKSSFTTVRSEKRAVVYLHLFFGHFPQNNYLAK